MLGLDKPAVIITIEEADLPKWMPEHGVLHYKWTQEMGDIYPRYVPLCLKDHWPVWGTTVVATDDKALVTCQECLEWLHA